MPGDGSDCFRRAGVDATALQDAEGFLTGLNSYFEELEDPRVVGRCDHLLRDILARSVLARSVLAVLCGAEDFPDIEEFGKRRKDWLGEFLELPGGIPSHDTFRRVLGCWSESNSRNGWHALKSRRAWFPGAMCGTL
jgi:hypothetical protein